MKRKILSFTFSTIFMFIVFQINAQQQLTGDVARILDGDTFDLLLTNHTIERIRLSDIDAPEKSQDFGKQAKQYLTELVATKKVDIIFSKRDRNKRILGAVYLNHRYINLQMVESGFAWHFLKYSSNLKFAEAQRKAQKAKRGLWSQPKAIEPWEYRKLKRSALKLHSFDRQ
jgi:micrococcal nuclease